VLWKAEGKVWHSIIEIILTLTLILYLYPSSRFRLRIDLCVFFFFFSFEIDREERGSRLFSTPNRARSESKVVGLLKYVSVDVNGVLSNRRVVSLGSWII
jgi:hypothetical protein